MKVVTRALLGADIEHEVPALRNALHRLARWAPLLAAPGGKALERVRLPIVGRLGEAIKTIETAVDRQIAQGGDTAPLLEALLHSTADLPSSRRLVRDEVMTIFLAGHDTTSAALTWTWLLLGSHPEVESRLHGEIASVLGGRKPRMDDLDKLPYVAMVVKETLRLYPPIRSPSAIRGGSPIRNSINPSGGLGRRPSGPALPGFLSVPGPAPAWVSTLHSEC